MNSFILLYFLIAAAGGSLILFDYDDVHAQSTDFQLPSLSLNTPYSDMPTNMQGSLSDLGDIDEEVDSKVNQIIKPSFQNPLEKSESKVENEDSPRNGAFEDGFSEHDTITSSGVGSHGDVYVIDYSNIRVQKFNTQGDFISKWGTKGKADGQFGVPHGVDVDKEGNVYVVDMDNNNVQKFDSEGNFLFKWGSMGTGDGQFNAPEGVAIDSLDNIYVTDADNNNVQKFDSEGNFISKWGTTGEGEGQFKKPAGLDIDKNDNIYVVDAGNSRIQKFDQNGDFLSTWGSMGSNNDQFLDPHSIVVS